MAIAVYPGTFDPLTAGHEDIMRRASRIFDQAILGISESKSKNPIFTHEERLEIAREALAPYPNVKVVGFNGLLRDFVRSQNATVIVRGVRTLADFEYEFQMSGLNKHLMPEAETIFMTPTEDHIFISGTLVREIAMFGGDISRFVPPTVVPHLLRKVAQRKAAAGS
jgi:pantetheine-phosphate adenylyltransferase